MRVAVVTPADPVVSLAEAKAHLRVQFGTDDDLIAALVAAATANLDGPAGWLGRAIGPQELEAFLGGFTHFHRSIHEREFDVDPRPGSERHIRLPYGPILSVTSVKYDDVNGEEQTFDPSLYALKGDLVALAYGATWPAYRGGPESVRITYVAGYAADPDADPLVAAPPAPIKTAILLMVAALYENRSADVIDSARVTVVRNPMVDALTDPYRVWSA